MLQYKSKVDVVYEYLLKNQVAKQCGVSDIPVREAIRRLESEGYLSLNANQGAVVCRLDQNSLSAIFHIKGVVEGYATRISVDYLTPGDIKKLRQKNAQIQRAFEAGSDKKYSQLNMQFHLSIYEAIPQREYQSLIRDLWKKWSFTKSVFSFVPRRIEASIQEHEEIIRLIEEKDYDGVEQCVRRHKFQAGLELIRTMEEEEAQKGPMNQEV